MKGKDDKGKGKGKKGGIGGIDGIDGVPDAVGTVVLLHFNSNPH